MGVSLQNILSLGPGSPQVPQGTLNRLRASVMVPAFAELNVTAAFLGKEGISVALEGETTTFITTLTGTVQSPEPYQMATVTIHLLKSQNLAALYKAQMEVQANIGDITVIADASTLPDYQIINCAIASIRELSFAGEDAGFAITVRGYYSTNSAAWGQV